MGLERGRPLASLKKAVCSHEQIKVFHSDSALTHDMVDAGEKALVLVYNRMLTDTGFPPT